ncbi:MAG: hypothetical protein ACR2P8_00890 [Myxococcota bacterium]
MKRAPASLVAGTTLGLVVAFLLVDWLLDGSRPPPGGYAGGDLLAYFVPTFRYIRASFGACELPLWNPHELAGSPFLATHQPGVLNPLWWPFLPLPPAAGISGVVLLHLWLAGFFTWLYLRRLEVSAAAALAAALAYLLSHWVLSGPFNLAYGAAFAWTPAVFWALQRLLAEPGPRRAALLAGVIALAFLAGYAQGFLYLAQLAGAYALFGLLSLPPEARLRALGWTGAAGALAALLCAAQLLPSLELAQQATRSLGGLSLADANIGARSAGELWQRAWGGRGPASLPWLTLPLAALALAGRRRRAPAIFFVLALLVLADFMRGAGGFVFPLSFGLPGGSLFRGPLRASFAYEFAAAVLIGLGAQRLEDWLGRRLPRVALVSLAIAAAVGAGRYLAFEDKYAFPPLSRPEALEGPAELVSWGRRLGGNSRLFIEIYPNANLPYRMGQMYGFESVPDYEPLLPAAYRRYFGIEGIWHGNLTVLPRPPYAGFVVDPARLDWLAVSHYADAGLHPKPRTAGPLRRIVRGPVVDSGAIPVVERRSALPRAFVAERVETLPDEASVLARMRATPARPLALVTREDAARAEGPLPEGSRGAVKIRTRSVNRVELGTSCSEPCFVVLNDLHYPGWRARIDGEPAPLLRTNYLFRGVAVPAGSHRLEFVYRPSSFVLGAALSGVGALALLLLLLAAPGRGRRSPGEPAATPSPG